MPYGKTRGFAREVGLSACTGILKSQKPLLEKISPEKIQHSMSGYIRKGERVSAMQSRAVSRHPGAALRHRIHTHNAAPRFRPNHFDSHPLLFDQCEPGRAVG